jgi:hypothetical protein
MNARFDRRDRIVCGIRSCGGLLGVVVLVSDADPVYDRVAVLPEGWRPDTNGVWSPTRYAARRHAMFGSYKNRRAPRWDDAPEQNARRLFVRVHPLPARVRCPKRGCRWIQVLDPTVLSVSTSWRPVEVSGESSGPSDPATVPVDSHETVFT